MSDVPSPRQDVPLPAPAAVTLGSGMPDIEQLFLFARDAELRVRSLRMRIDERTRNARGEVVTHHELLLRHPGHVRVTTRHSDDPITADYDVWLGDGVRVRTYSAGHKVTTDRARRAAPVGGDHEDLPPWARTREPLTHLPPGSIVDAFVHPHGLFRQVMVSGPAAITGTHAVGDREAILVRTRHPRSTKILTDRPDRVVEVGVGRDSGFLLLLTERIGDVVTHHAVVTSLEIDPDIVDTAFELRTGDDARRIY
jgi:hypothetical protein